MNNFAIVYICLQAVGALLLANAHGKRCDGYHNFWVGIIVAIPAWVCVYFGGLFK